MNAAEFSAETIYSDQRDTWIKYSKGAVCITVYGWLATYKHALTPTTRLRAEFIVYDGGVDADLAQFCNYTAKDTGGDDPAPSTEFERSIHIDTVARVLRVMAPAMEKLALVANQADQFIGHVEPIIYDNCEIELYVEMPETAPEQLRALIEEYPDLFLIPEDMSE